jgi:glycosyltransferase involved in cell wall biosynthesis
VLYLNHTGEMSGAERSLLTLLEGLPDAVSPVVTCPEGRFAREVASLGVPVEAVAGTDASLRLHPIHTPRAIGEMVASAWRVRRIARSLQADLVHANSIRAGLIAGLAKRFGGPPVVTAVHDHLPPGLVSRLTQRTIAANVDMVFACSRYVAEPFHQLDVSVPVRVVYNPIDLDRFNPAAIERERARSRLGFSDATFLLGLIGQVTPWKAQDDAVRMVAHLKARHPEVRLVLVGSPKFSSARFDNQGFARELKELVASLGVEDHVIWLGERRDIPEILRALDVVLVPSWEEPFGMAVIESMAMEVPVVATAVGGAGEVVTPPENGLLLLPRRPDAWAEAIYDLVERPDLRTAIGRAARRRVAEFLTVESYVERVLAGYGDVLTPKTPDEVEPDRR